tara:strand:+ start:1199 stop:2383 length:1185 start_codon:yes stop_codon:yes gene_type:complete
MKFIGQFIQHFISRFKNDVFLDNISSGTIASGGNLGLDSNNKIVKATEVGATVDLASEVTGVLPSANLDADTAHLSGFQTFTGTKTFSNSIIVQSTLNPKILVSGDGAGPSGDGAAINVSVANITDNSTSASGTATKFTHINIKAPTLLATNASVTTTDAATLYVNGPPNAHTNQTITNSWALWVDSGNARFDGSIYSGTTEAINSSGLLTVANQSNITGVGTISSGTWQGTAIASAYLDADTAHLSTQKHMTHHSFTADIDTTKTYVGLVDADSEATSTTGIDMPLVFPVASKLLQVTLRSNKNLSGLTYTWRLETQATGVGFATGPTIVGTQSGAGPAQVGHATYDFTTSLDSGDNIVDAFDAVYLSLQSSGATANTKYYITCVWETDMSGY